MPRKTKLVEKSESSEMSDSVSESESESKMSGSASSVDESESESTSVEKIVPVKKKRNFKRIDPKTGENIGRYIGATPKQAASKSYTRYVMTAIKLGKRVPKKTDIFIRESTIPSQKKIYAYHAKRIKLDEPQVIQIRDKAKGTEKIVTYKYRNVITKIEVPAKIHEVMEQRNLEKKEQRAKAREEDKKQREKALEKENSKQSKKNKKSTKTTKSAKTTKSTKAKVPVKKAKKAAPAKKATPTKKAKKATPAKKATKASKNASRAAR